MPFYYAPISKHVKFIYVSLLNCAPCAPSRLTIIDSRLRALPTINTCLTRLHAYAPYPSVIRASRVCIFTRHYRHQQAPYALLSCVVLLQLKGKVCFECALQLTIHPRLSSLLVYHIKVFCMLFFFSFKLLVTPLFIQLFCNNIQVSLKYEGADLMKTVQLFEFHFFPTV